MVLLTSMAFNKVTLLILAVKNSDRACNMSLKIMCVHFRTSTTVISYW